MGTHADDLRDIEEDEAMAISQFHIGLISLQEAYERGIVDELGFDIRPIKKRRSFDGKIHIK